MDEWRWYCRLCGATGSAPSAGQRDAKAACHLFRTWCGEGRVSRIEDAGHLRHVWTYTPWQEGTQ